MQLPSSKNLSMVKLVENRGTLFLLFFLALSAIALSIWQGFSYFASRQERAVLMQNAVNNGLANLQQRAFGRLAGNATSLHIIASSSSLQQFANDNTKARDELEQLFLSFIESSTNVYQIRYIDSSGLELIRIDRNGDTYQFASPPELQNKQDRDYFSVASKNSPGQIYVSDVELNIENGQIQEPWVPTIRLATPVNRSDQQLAGVLVVNIDANDIIGIYDATNTAARVEVMLANSEGFWLYGKPDERLWGFMFSKPSSIASDHSAVWQQIQENNSRSFIVDENRWTYRSAKVSDLFPKGLSYSNANKVLWHAVVKDPPLPIAEGPASYIPPIVILLTLLGFSWAWTRSVIEKRRAEQELVKSEKMSSLGGLVAGVAHELNTPIGSAVTISSTIQEKAKDLYLLMEKGEIKKSDISEFVTEVQYASNIILRGLNRANELINHFKQIAVDQSCEQRRIFLLDDYVEEMTATFKHLFRHRLVMLELDLDSHATLDSYPGPLSQVVINLVQNALIHGFGPEEDGTIRIATRSLDNNLVELSVTDSGVGIPGNIINRVFEPFFTTKLGQGGSGLGLHIVYNIVKDGLGGNLQVASDTKRRTTQFTLTIPRVSTNIKPISAGRLAYVRQTAA